jgi:hypothetical protein
MTKLTTGFAIIAVVVAVSGAQAENAPTTNISPSPNSINKGSSPTVSSGAESQSKANNRPARVADAPKCRSTGPSIACMPV